MNHSNYISEPWKIHKTNSTVGGFEIQTEGSDLWLAIVQTHPDLDGEKNARLIASAPELLDALESCLKLLIRIKLTDPDAVATKDAVNCVSKIQKAIEKAKGES